MVHVKLAPEISTTKGNRTNQSDLCTCSVVHVDIHLEHTGLELYPHKPPPQQMVNLAFQPIVCLVIGMLNCVIKLVIYSVR